MDAPPRGEGGVPLGADDDDGDYAGDDADDNYDSDANCDYDQGNECWVN